LSLKTKVIME